MKNINFNKLEFTLELKKKDKIMKEYRYILFMKYVYLKQLINIFQISIIFASTIITFVESIKRHLLLNDKISQIISICLSTYIGIFTAIFRFLKIDDKKEEIYKILQIINDIETIINNKIKSIELLQNTYDDEVKFILLKNNINQNCNNILDISSVCSEKEIVEKYYNDYSNIINHYKNENIDEKILNAQKQFGSIFSYNEVIYYKGKIIEGMLLEQLHNTNRKILELPMDKLKYNHFNDVSNNYIINDIENLYDEDDHLYSNTLCNNLCLYFSKCCKFCLIMNLYLNLSIKRGKIRALNKNKYQQENPDNIIKFLYCRIKCIDNLVKNLGCKKLCCCCNDDISGVPVYFCCDC